MGCELSLVAVAVSALPASVCLSICAGEPAHWPSPFLATPSLKHRGAASPESHLRACDRDPTVGSLPSEAHLVEGGSLPSGLR